MSSKPYAAFLSYSSRYREWVTALHRNLEHCLPLHGENRPVFFDQTDLGVGHSWVAQLQAGLDEADQLVLVVTPEALASPRVADEWEAFVAKHPEWTGRLQVLMLVDTPRPPFLERIQYVDFEDCDGPKYRHALGELLSGLLGQRDRRKPPSLANDIEVPDAPSGLVPRDLRRRLVSWLAPILSQKLQRIAVSSVLGLPPPLVEGHPSWDCAASAVLVKATGDDVPLAAAHRIVKTLQDTFEGDEERLKTLCEIADELARADTGGRDEGLLGLWLTRVERDHSELLPYFEQRTELPLLDQVYVQLQLRGELPRMPKSAGNVDALGHFGRALTLPEVLKLTDRQLPGVTHRWVVIGDPGAGKTTLLRHLAASFARESPPRRVPVFDSLPRLMRDREWLFDRLERLLNRAGHQARGLPAVLEDAGREGHLVLLLDGLDEVPRDDRADAEDLLRDLSARWPSTAVVVTSRPIGYRRPAHDFWELELQPFDGASRREFLARWFGRTEGELATARADEAATALEQDATLRDLAGNPLYLTLMALLIEKGTSPAHHRTGLYDQVFQLLLDGGHRPAGEPIEAQAAVRRALRHLAREMTEANLDAEPVAALEARLYDPGADALREALERVPRWRRSLRPFLDDLSERTGILGPHDGPNADWRYWHRTFREALAAEWLEEKLGAGEGEAHLLDHARQIAVDDLSRWAEPYALLTGRVQNPDALVKSLVEANRDLGLRALSTAQRLRDETLSEVLKLTGKWEERRDVYQQIPELMDDPPRILALLDQLRRRTRNGNDLFFLELAARAVAEKWPDTERAAGALLKRFFDHLPTPPEELFRWIETPLDGRVEIWREIPAGGGWIGSPEGVGHDDERPRHRVELVRPFQLAAVPVTNAQYAAFDPERAGGEPHHPVDSVTWYEAVSFCRWLSTLPDLAGARLPTEEEWEYACRAGSEAEYWNGDGEEALAEVGWYDANSDRRLHRVGEKRANPWGLYDVHGNVWEWTATVWDQDRYSGRDATGIRVDPAEKPADLAGHPGAGRVIRGGSYWNDAVRARSAYRSGNVPDWDDGDQGFRVLVPGAPS